MQFSCGHIIPVQLLRRMIMEIYSHSKVLNTQETLLNNF